MLFSYNAVAVPNCAALYYANVTNVTCKGATTTNGTDIYRWEPFECIRNACIILTSAIDNGYYTNSVTGEEAVAGTYLDYRVASAVPVCNAQYSPNTTSVQCQRESDYMWGGFECFKDDDTRTTCPELAPTTNFMSCSLATGLYTCTLYCNHGYLMVTPNTTVTSTPTTCDYTTNTWSHDNGNNTNRSWDKCLKEATPAHLQLFSTLTLTGSGKCLTLHSLHTALDTWLSAQSTTQYGCYGSGACYLTNRYTCEAAGNVINYSFGINMTENVDYAIMESFEAQLKSDALANKIKLVIISKKRSSSTILTSQSIITKIVVTCFPGSQLVHQVCVQCSEGLYSSGIKCEECPLGSYSNNTGSAQCEACTGTRSTLLTAQNNSEACIDICYVPTLKNGTSTPPEGTRIAAATPITVLCNTGFDVGHENITVTKCSEQYSCYRQCQLPNLTTHQNYTAHAPGDIISYGSDVTVRCINSQDTLTCLGITLTLQGCTPTIRGADVVDILAGTATSLHCEVSTIADPVTISWYNSTDHLLTNSTVYSIYEGTFNNSVQNSTLEISGEGTPSDRVFRCKAESVSLETQLRVDVFVMEGFDTEVIVTRPAAILCTVTGATVPLPIYWRYKSGLLVITSNKLTVVQEYQAGLQTSTLTLASATANQTFVCLVGSNDGVTHMVTVEVTIKGSNGTTRVTLTGIMGLLCIVLYNVAMATW